MLLFGAVLAAAIGYAEGGLLARELGAWQAVSWALVLSAPLMTALTVASVTQQAPTATPVQWLAFAYLCIVSMYLGFFAWYRGLAIGPMAQVSQVQLVQPVLSILWATLLLREQLDLAHHPRRRGRHRLRPTRRPRTAAPAHRLTNTPRHLIAPPPVRPSTGTGRSHVHDRAARSMSVKQVPTDEGHVLVDARPCGPPFSNFVATGCHIRAVAGVFMSTQTDVPQRRNHDHQDPAEADHRTLRRDGEELQPQDVRPGAPSRSA